MKKLILFFISMLNVPFHIMAMEQTPENREALREKFFKDAQKAALVTEQEKKRAIGEFEFHRNFKNKIVLSPDDFVKDYPVLFENVPPHLYQKIVDYAVFLYGDQAFLQLKQQFRNKKINPQYFKWKALGFAYNVVPYISTTNKYFYFEQNDKKDTNLKGIRNDHVLRIYLECGQEAAKVSEERDQAIAQLNTLREDFQKNCKGVKLKNNDVCLKLDRQIMQLRNELLALTAEFEKIKKEQKRVGRSMVEEYKIHLMPDGDPTPVIILLLEALKNDSTLQHAIAAFKVLSGKEYVLNGLVYPRIVIYPTAGKPNAQFVLQKLYELLKNVDGLDERPRFNGKVTDLIWVAQGDSMFKQGKYLKYYEAPHYMYYNPEFMGKKENYHLLHPQTQQEIVY